MNAIKQLRQHTIVVADTGDIEAIAKHRPQDATTNPSLLYKAAQMPQYGDLVREAIAVEQKTGQQGEALVDAVIDRLSVIFGIRILQLVP